ncbi:MAG: recombinase family protein, partial [Phycisphaerae bacterium]
MREGHARRVQSGLFCGAAPYGYRNIRIDGRGLIKVDDQQAEKVKRLFQMYAYENHTIDSMRQKLEAAGITYTATMPRWARSKVHSILRDRAYIGEVRYRGQWYPGKHPPLVDRATFERVQVLLGVKRYQGHDLTYAGSLVRCGHCGAVITGESVTKKKTGREYVYYRCSKYTAPGHPRIRLTEGALDAQVLALFDRIRLPDDLGHWFQQCLLAWSKQQRSETEDSAKELRRQITLATQARDRLLNLRIMEEITADTYAAKDTELRDRLA